MADVVVELKTAMNNYPNSGHVNLSIEHARAILSLLECAEGMAKLLDAATFHNGNDNERRSAVLAKWEALRG